MELTEFHEVWLEVWEATPLPGPCLHKFWAVQPLILTQLIPEFLLSWPSVSHIETHSMLPISKHETHRNEDGVWERVHYGLLYFTLPAKCITWIKVDCPRLPCSLRSTESPKYQEMLCKFCDAPASLQAIHELLIPVPRAVDPPSWLPSFCLLPPLPLNGTPSCVNY